MENIFISGISSGIGKGLAHFYADKGVKVYGISRRDLDYNHKNIKHMRCDISELNSSDDLSSLIDTKELDLVILNAGVLGNMTSMKDASMSDLKSTMDTNLWAQKSILDIFLKNYNVKSIFGISSGAAINGNVGWSGYSLSKAAFNMLIQLYAKENPDIHFLAFAPGLVDTAMQDYISNEVDSNEFPSVERLQQAKGTSDMPTPNQFAIKFDESLIRVSKMESGRFVDIRKL
jgi:NAD(P)-dependent dehydrogenase (short-subunit alcohol dehydrogenase family)